MSPIDQGMRSFERGSITEAIILTYLAKAGYTVLLPFGVARYDLAIDARDGAGIKTVQCKTGRVRRGAIIWATCSSHTITHERTDYRGQADYFAVWCPDFEDDVYLVPVNDVGTREGSLRVIAVGNGQKNTRWAENFKVGKITGM